EQVLQDHIVFAGVSDPAVPHARYFGPVGIPLLGVIVFVLCCATAYWLRPTIAIRMDADLRSAVSGFYPYEIVRGTDRAWAWTRSHAELSMPALDRRIAWRWRADVLLNR